MKETAYFFRMIWPPFCGIVLVTLGFFLKMQANSAGMIEIPVLDIYILKIPLSSSIAIRAILFISAFLFFLIPALRDYSELFPSEFKLKVYFDKAGLKKALSSFSKNEKAAFNIKENWEEDQARYLFELNSYIKKELGSAFKFSPEHGKVHSSGQISFEAQRTKGAWQRYEIKQANGTLEHTFETVGASPITLHSAFCLLDTTSNHIQATVTNIYVQFCIIISPTFKQTIMLSAAGTPFYHHNLICITKIHFFPLLYVGKTIYLKQNNTGETFPIGFAHNFPV